MLFMSRDTEKYALSFDISHVILSYIVFEIGPLAQITLRPLLSILKHNLDFRIKKLGSERTYLGSKRTYLGSKRTYLGSERTYLGSKRTYLGSKLTLLYFHIIREHMLLISRHEYDYFSVTVLRVFLFIDRAYN